jgi:hypothetical protein
MRSKQGKYYLEYARNTYRTPEERAALAQYNNQELILNKGEMSAYRDPSKREIIIAHRGTNQKRDLSADLALGLGVEKYHPRFKRERKQTKAIRKANPGYSITHTGHSLGGALAERSSSKNDKVMTYQKAAGPTALVKKRRRNQTDFIHGYDPVSMMSHTQRGGKQIRTMKFTLNPHSSYNL